MFFGSDVEAWGGAGIDARFFRDLTSFPSLTLYCSSDSLGGGNNRGWSIPNMSRVLTGRDFKDGFWYHRPDEGFPPPCIRDPDEYDGLPMANVVCTQTNLPRWEQTKLVRRWCEVLPTFSGLEFLWFHSKVSQELFDAACMVPNLRGLYVKWSGIKRIDTIARSKHLRFLHLGSSQQLESIEPLTELKELVWLELENIKRITDLAPLSELRRLAGLVVEGSMWTTQVVSSLAPIGELHELRYLRLANLKTKDKTLRPLFSLRLLERFHAAHWWSEDELRQLQSVNPKL